MQRHLCRHEDYDASVGSMIRLVRVRSYPHHQAAHVKIQTQGHRVLESGCAIRHPFFSMTLAFNKRPARIKHRSSSRLHWDSTLNPLVSQCVAKNVEISSGPSRMWDFVCLFGWFLNVLVNY